MFKKNTNNIDVCYMLFKINQIYKIRQETYYLTSGSGPASPSGGIRFLIFLLLVLSEIPDVDW